jgi:hypothetical protein
MRQLGDISHSDRRYQSDMRRRARLMAQREQQLGFLRRQVKCLQASMTHMATGDQGEQQRAELAQMSAELAKLESQPPPPLPKRR